MPTIAALLLLLLRPAQKSASSSDPFAPITLYEGVWKVTPSFSGTGTDTLRNDCRRFTEFYACQQTVNEHVSALVVFVYAGTPGHYHTQPIEPSGAADGRGDLMIDGNRLDILRQRYTGRQDDLLSYNERHPRYRPHSF